MGFAVGPRLKSRGGLILGGLLLYGVFLIVQMPASWLVPRLSATSPWQFDGVGGSSWSGTAQRLIWRSEGQRLELGRLSWSWIPGELLRGRLAFAFELGQAPDQLRGTYLLGPSGRELRDVQGRLDAGVITLASRLLGLLQPQGSLLLNVPDLRLEGGLIRGDARVDWQGARSGLIAAPLGYYRMEMRAEEDGRQARITINTLQGALAMNGEGDYVPGKGATGRLVIMPPQDASRTVYTRALDLFGRPDAKGAWTLHFGDKR